MKKLWEQLDYDIYRAVIRKKDIINASIMCMAEFIADDCYIETWYAEREIESS